MRTLLAGPITPLLGSLAVHGCALLLVVLAVQRAPPRVSHTRAESWAGDALEVDAIAIQNAVPNVANNESPEPVAAASPEPPQTEAATPASAVALTTKSDGFPPSKAPTPQKRSERVRRRPTTDAAPGIAPASDAPGTGRPSSVAATGSFGSAELPAGVVRLPSAFTRAIPPATGADPIWQALPAGTQRPFSIAVRVDADGRIQDSKILGDHAGAAPPEQFTHLRERVVALLGAGLFALGDHVAPGYCVFRITITLSDRPLDTESEPAQLVERGFDPPRGSQPGRAYFTLASGRHFVAKVEVLNAQHAP